MDINLKLMISAGLGSGLLFGYCASRFFSSSKSNIKIRSKVEPNAKEIETQTEENVLLSRSLETFSNDLTYNANENFPNLRDNRSFMARYLTKKIYSDLYNRRTPLGFTIDKVLQAALDNPNKGGCGIVAGDEYCYEVFAPVFDPVIAERHEGFKRKRDMATVLDQESPSQVSIERPIQHLYERPFDSKLVKSSYFLISRCLSGFRFSPSCSRAERNHIELQLKTALLALTGDYKGTYIHLAEMTTEIKSSLPDILQTASNTAFGRTLSSRGEFHDWPFGRGVFYNSELTLMAWVNFEDHLRIMYRSEDPNIKESYKKFQSAIRELEEKLLEVNITFAFHPEYGYLLSCPSAIGTTLIAVASVKLPRTIRHDRFRDIARNLRIHIRAKDRDALKKGWVDVYNKDRLGFTEEELLNQVADAVHKLCEIETNLENDGSFSDLLSYRSILQ
ncbi:creatine kinase M-type-like isoform X1 [Hydra vulgaris]|uniref:Creatine kinase M-type-like isoform X1 n=2 Tax=Hydra vulgaris TaxID=6087 RepID=A0ABM4C7F9_HYDVU